MPISPGDPLAPYIGFSSKTYIADLDSWYPGLGGDGEANTASNAGLTGEGLVEPKDGVDLPFRSITAGEGISVVHDAPNKTLVISNTAPENNVLVSTDDYSGSIPGTEWDWDGDAEEARGHLNGETLPYVIDNSNHTNDGYNLTGSQEPILETNLLNGHAGFNLENNKFVITAKPVLTPAYGSTAFVVTKQTGLHVEHGFFFGFINQGGDGNPNALAWGIKESASVNYSGHADDALQFNSFFVKVLSTAWHDIAVRCTGYTTGIIEVFADGVLQEIFDGVTGASVGFAVDYGGLSTLRTPCYVKMGNGAIGGGNGLSTKQLKNQGYSRALSDAEIATRSAELHTRFGY